MKNKKLLALGLATTMIMSMGTTAFAANVDQDGGTAETTVKGTYVAPTPPEIITADITWGSMAFTYDDNQADGSKWVNPTSADDQKVTVQSGSNVAIDATLVFTGAAVDETAGVKTAITGGIFDEATAGTAVDKLSFAADDTTAQSAYLQINGGAITKNATLGSVKVTIAKKIVPIVTFNEQQFSVNDTMNISDLHSVDISEIALAESHAGISISDSTFSGTICYKYNTAPSTPLYCCIEFENGEYKQDTYNTTPTESAGKYYYLTVKE